MMMSKDCPLCGEKFPEHFDRCPIHNVPLKSARRNPEDRSKAEYWIELEKEVMFAPGLSRTERARRSLNLIYMSMEHLSSSEFAKFARRWRELTAPLQESSSYSALDPKSEELEKPENARWLALLIDSEGAMGWTRKTERKDKIDERYRFVRIYRTPYLGVAMSERESGKIILEASRLTGVPSYVTRRYARRMSTDGGRALTIIRYTKPYHVKYERMANLLLALFKHRPRIPIETFDWAIAELFGRYLPPEEALDIVLDMRETEFRQFLRRAERIADEYLAVKYVLASLS